MALWSKLKHWLTSKPSSTITRSLREAQRIIGYEFRDEILLRTGLTHRSYSHSSQHHPACNERLEFLGDSVLGLIIAEQLYREYPDMQEGQLTQTKALLVNEATLAEVARDIGLNDHLLLAAEEERMGGRDRTSTIADAFEAVIGAVFLDGGMAAARDIVLRLLYSRKEDILSDAARRNFKGELLELVQARGEGPPRYDVISEEGPDHRKLFHVEVFVGATRCGIGSGFSKKEAEQHAAAMALERYRQHSDQCHETE